MEMKINLKKRKREFPTGLKKLEIIKDCGSVYLNKNEMITFKSKNKNLEYDVVKKKWGYYATPSLNVRLINKGYKSILVKNRITKRYFVFLQEIGMEKELKKYMEQESLEIICRLDEIKNLKKIEFFFGKSNEK